MIETVFRDKVCVVTGGASGLGREIGRRLAASGASVVLADIDEKGLNDAVGAITHAGGRAKGVRVDVTDQESVRSLIERTVIAAGRIDYLFNNAGAATPGESAT